jgi:pimeloyl-ACP methyl ester carboxylesterase
MRSAIVRRAMSTIDRDGVRIHYEAAGPSDGRPALLLSHGFRASTTMWEPNLPALAAKHRVLAWDMRGHGRSEGPDDPALYSQDLSVADMAALLDAEGIERAVLIGMSLGGYLSLAFRRRFPERVAALVLVDTGPGFRRDEEREAWNAWVEKNAAEVEVRGAAALPDSPEVSSHDPAALARAARGIMAQRDALVIESLPTIDVPTLIVVGAEDHDFLRAAATMEKRIPHARRVVIEGAGHAANMDAPETFNAAVLDLLSELP